MADAFVQILLENLHSLIQKEVGLLWGVDKEMKRLSSLLSTIQDVLEDAEKQVGNKAIQNWLRKLRDAAYMADDILDECATKAEKVKTSFLNRYSPSNILFCHKIGNRMRDIRERLDEIAEERMKFHLNEVVADRRAEVIEGRQTGSIVTQSKVYGRDEDREIIVESLVKHVACCDEISVYPIVGIGGLGKTTLAQVIFDDERVKSHFELRIWVCVSEDFNVRRLVKAMIESATRTACEALDLDPLQKRLQDMLNGKRYLLVLDDVWNEDQEKWDRLKYVLSCGSKGASIIVTTRIKRVASIMGTVPLHNLSNLTEEDCWSLFRERAFGQVKEENPIYVAIGKEIVKKCGGVPLAVKSVGGLMCFKSEVKEWLSVKESELWNLPQDESSILPALRLSYSNLPSNLRQCFVSCAIFPKDFVFDRVDLVHFWMANGFIPFTGKMEPEDAGDEICNDLLQPSFLQDESKDDLGNIVVFKMHDLVHDLAQSIMEDACCIVEAESSNNISKRNLHVMLDANLCQSYRVSKALYEVENLRTLLLKSYKSSLSSTKSNAIELSFDFSKLSSLRVLCLSSGQLVKLPSSIRHLIHLRYLNLSSTSIQVLPESICSLVTLQTLVLRRCWRLRELPKRMRRLKNLRHLFLCDFNRLSHMPRNIAQLTCLKTLTLFVVGKKRGCLLAELKELNLGGKLCIKRLQRVANPMDAKEANLIGKQNLQRLYLSWDRDSEIELQENVEKVLEALEPHPSLKNLVVENYKGKRFPLWMRDDILSNVVSITLSNCENCLQLPPLGQLPLLRALEVSGMIHVQYIDNSSEGREMIKGFPCLETLTVNDLPNLQRLSRKDARMLLPCLDYLNIKSCPKLSLPCLPSVKGLSIMGCNEGLLRSISNLRSLDFLSVFNNDELVHLPHDMLENLTSLQSLSIGRFSKLKVFSPELISLNALESLHISDCHELESFAAQGLEGLIGLRKLALFNCRKVTLISEGLQHLSALENLSLNGCPELVDLPEGMKHLSSLQELKISGRSSCIDGSKSGLRNPTGFHKLTLMGNIDGEPVACPKLVVLPEALRQIPALQSLCISCYPELASLPHWMGDLTSLQSLQIFDCPKLSSLPASIQRLTKLQNLDISQCPELVKRCEKETGQDWHKIAHVQNLYVE